MKECSKSIARRLTDANFAARYFVGAGLDIGGKPDPLALYAELFPRVSTVRTWDLEDGDAEELGSRDLRPPGCIASGQRDLMASPLEQPGERGSPGARADDGNPHPRRTKSMITGTPSSPKFSRTRFSIQ